MGHDETPVENFNAQHVTLTPADEVSSTPAHAGRLKLSGSKLWLDTGTAWEVVSSS